MLLACGRCIHLAAALRMHSVSTAANCCRFEYQLKHWPCFHCVSSIVNGNQLKLKCIVRTWTVRRSCLDNKANRSVECWGNELAFVHKNLWLCVMQVICGALVLLENVHYHTRAPSSLSSLLDIYLTNIVYCWFWLCSSLRVCSFILVPLFYFSLPSRLLLYMFSVSIFFGFAV